MTRRPRSTALALLAAAAVGSIARPAGAEGRTSSLAWVRMPGAEACIDARALAQAVELRLRRPAFVPPTRGDVTISRRGFTASRSASPRIIASAAIDAASSPAPSCRIHPRPQTSTPLSRSTRPALSSTRPFSCSTTTSAVFVLFELEELPMTEVAEAVGCPLQTACARFNAARRTVEAALRRATMGRRIA